MGLGKTTRLVEFGSVAAALERLAEPVERPEVLILTGACWPSNTELFALRTQARDALVLAVLPREQVSEHGPALAHSDDFLLTPVDPVELQLRIESLARSKRRAHRQHRGEAGSVELFRAFADTMPLLAWYAEPDGYISWYNRRWYEYTGQTLADQAGWGWQSVHDPEHLSRVVQSWTASLASGEPWEDIFPLRRYDGRYRWFLSRAEPLRDDTGRIIRWFGTNVDVDEHERATQTLAFLTNAGRVLGASLDLHANLDALLSLAVPARADGVIVYLPDEQDHLRIVASRNVDPDKDALLRETLREYPIQLDAPFGAAAVLRSGESQLASKVDESLREAAAQSPDHLARLRALAARSVLHVPITAQGRRLGVLALVIDQSDRSYHADDLPWAEELGWRVGVAIDNARLFELTERERERAEQANRTKDQFLSIASHELRTPLNAILGWAQILRDGLLPDKQAHAISIIERNARIQVQLIDDILDVSRIITGKLRLEARAIDLGEVVSAAIDVVQTAADAKDITIAHSRSEALGMRGDAGRLQQVVWNLLSNAIKFTPEGGRVEIIVRRVAEQLELVVRDSGRGMPPEFLTRVFEPFSQADASTTRTTSGLGLGLAIAKHLIELHGGQIEAHSGGLGQGSTFLVRLPAHQRRPAAARQSDLARQASLSPAPTLAGLRLLVVDDESDARELLGLLLERCHAQVRTASSASDALRLLEAEPFDLLISDIGMPGEDGFSLLRQARQLERARQIPAIALTAFASAADRDRALAAGFAAHLSKPVEADHLLATVRKQCRL